MEHRYCERVEVDLKAAVYKRGLVVGSGRIKNGSKHGLLLETQYDDVNVLQKLVIEVVLRVNPQKTKRYELNTIVVRKSSEGLGLELETIGEKDSLAMSDLINAVHLMKDQPVSRSKFSLAPV